MATPAYTGGCLCGGVRYTVRGELPPIQICHCSQCRKAQGTPFASNLPVEMRAYTLDAGAELIQEYESSPGKQRAFCRRCGSPLYSRRTDLPGVLRLRAGCFDGDLPVQPDAHGYAGSKANWWPITDDLPQFSGARPAASEVSAATAAMPLLDGIDHIYIAVSDMAASEAYYDRVFIAALKLRKNRFALNGEPHVQYYGRHFGYVIRPARRQREHDAYAPGLHHFCMRAADAPAVHAAFAALSQAGVACSEPACFEQYASDYTAIFFSDPDGVRLEITNYRAERRERHDRWVELGAG